MTLGDRIASLLRERKISQSELARMVGVKQQTISYIIRGSDQPASASRYSTKIAMALGVNPAWLQTGEGSPADPTVPVKVDGKTVKVLQVPLLEKPEAVRLCAGERVVAKQFLVSDSDGVGKCFALEVHHRSMAPLFRIGDRVIVDTGIKPQPGDHVFALVRGEPIFRRYRERSDGFELVPENPDWETVASGENVQVLAVMTEHRRYRSFA